MADSPAGASAIDITESIADARRARRRAGVDSLNEEMWATYAAIGELLDSGRKDDAYACEVQDLVDRLVELDQEQQRQAAQRLATWVSRVTGEGGES